MQETEKLVFVRYVGKQFDGVRLYELFFSSSPETTFSVGEQFFDWDATPCNNKPDGFIDTMSTVGKIEMPDSSLVILAESHVFSMSDALDGIIAIAWEKNPPDGEKRIVLKFGMDRQEVEDIFYNREMVLIFNQIQFAK